MENDLCSSKSSPPPPSIFLKTKECKFFGRGKCTKGTSCPFAHAADEMRIRPNLSRTKMCRRVQSGGKCSDFNCNFAHELQERRRVPRHELPTKDAVADPPQGHESFVGRPEPESDAVAMPLATKNEQFVKDLETSLKQTLVSEKSLDGHVDGVVVLDVPWTRLALAKPGYESMAAVLPAQEVLYMSRFQ
eukprot:TRINITY_DN5821_c0_g1_i1.p1 TRINITY_DN5821_c0_g1~~TRINITY_DN5821_c0_g1_i1.p1  ORF type:complete len:190 (+),score=30.46 TRINITY_DN5821_c0_g1_i1:70-639(+)